MSHKIEDHNTNDFNKDMYVDLANERRMDQLVDLVEKHTRSERHLEQHSDISSPDQIQHTLDIQREREDEIENLRDIIIHGKGYNVNEEDHLKRNYEFTNGYLDNNSDTMDEFTLKMTEEKQKNRKNQINNYNK